MAAVTLRPAARADLLAIARYTELRWGTRQRYLAIFDQCFRELAVDPQRGWRRDGIRAGYRSIRVGKHILFYRVTPEGVDVVRILHERMDIPRHFREDE
jgi:toxin ParE1/3/4